MDFNSLLLIVIAWLLWSIHQDLTESNDRQRSIKTFLQQLADPSAQDSAQPPRTSRARKAPSKASSNSSTD